MIKKQKQKFAKSYTHQGQTPFVIDINIYIERERERERGSSYTFFKPLDLSKFNSKKKILINVNILIDLIYYLLFNTFYTYF